MSPYPVRFAVARPIRELIAEPIPQFCWDRSGSWVRRHVVRWLMHVASKLLRVCRARSLAEKITYTEVSVNERDLVSRLIEAGYRIEEFGNRRPRCVLVGPDIMTECRDLACSLSVRGELRRAESLDGGRSYHTEIVGFRIIFVPWMRGFLPVTDEIAKQMRP